jgi:AraC-like DNA-binding protein
MHTVIDRRWCRKRTVKEIIARDREMLHLFHAGWSIDRIARITCLTRRQVIRRFCEMGLTHSEIDRAR